MFRSVEISTYAHEQLFVRANFHSDRVLDFDGLHADAGFKILIHRFFFIPIEMDRGRERGGEHRGGNVLSGTGSDDGVSKAGNRENLRPIPLGRGYGAWQVPKPRKKTGLLPVLVAIWCLANFHTYFVYQECRLCQSRHSKIRTNYLPIPQKTETLSFARSNLSTKSAYGYSMIARTASCGGIPRTGYEPYNSWST